MLRRADLAIAATELRPGRRLVGLAAGAGEAVGSMTGGPATALVLGSEAHGISDPEVLDGWAHVPMPGAIESLNVAAAGAIALYALLDAGGPE